MGVYAQGNSSVQPWMESITYTSMRGSAYNLHAVRGRRVTVAFPDAWLDEAQGGLSAREAQELVDLSDLAYEQLADIVGGEPNQGPYPATTVLVAVVDNNASGGLTQLGTGRVEVSRSTLANVRDSLREGKLADIFIHEIAHAFDFYHGYILDYYTDSVHAWTEFLVPLIQYRMRQGIFETEAQGAFADEIRLMTLRWDAKLPQATPLWSSCLATDHGCESDQIHPNRAWAGMMMRYTRLYGVSALRQSFKRLNDLRRAGAAQGATARERNDLLIEALSDGAGEDITCALDMWRWEMSTGARARIKARYPATSPRCSDPPDFYASYAQVQAIGAAEPQPLALPGRIFGHLNDPGEVARFTFETNGPRSLLLRGMSVTPGWSFSVKVSSADTLSAQETAGLFYSDVEGVAKTVVPLERAGKWQLEVQVLAAVNGTAGDYHLVVTDSRPPTEPDSGWLTYSFTPQGTNGELSVGTYAELPASLAGARVRFWSSRTGEVDEEAVPASGNLNQWLWVRDGAASRQGSPQALWAQLLMGDEVIARTAPAIWSAGSGSSTASGVLPPVADLEVKARGGGGLRSAPTGASVGFPFEVINHGPDAVRGLVLRVALDPQWTIKQLSSTQGTMEWDQASSVVTAQLGMLVPGGRAAVWVWVGATGPSPRTVQVTGGASANDGAIDPESSNDQASFTVQIYGPSPSPTPSPSPSPTPQPSSPFEVRGLPLREQEGEQQAHALVPGSLARIIAPVGGLGLSSQVMGSPMQTGSGWSEPQLGVGIEVNGLRATLVSAAPFTAGGCSGCFAFDFVVPSALTPGDQALVSVVSTATHQTIFELRAQDSHAQIALAAPTLWQTEGGRALALDADKLLNLTESSPAAAGNRIILFAGGLARGAPTVIEATKKDGSLLGLVVEYECDLESLPGVRELVVRLPVELRSSGPVTLLVSSQGINSTTGAGLPVN